MLTQAGLATISGFLAASASPLFADLQRYSRDFRALHRTRAGEAAPYWKFDAMDHGMRRWEYPFLVERVLAYAAKAARPLRILDAGSGVTCIPYFFAERIAGATVDACDMDPPLPAMYAAMNRKAARPVTFTAADLRSLPYGDETFDVLMCMSVLEHTTGYDEIVREFRRVLRPGGRFVLTFDISIDGATDIAVDRAEKLIETLATHFDGVPREAVMPLARHIGDADRLTTGYLRESAPELLPWHMTPRFFLGAIRRLRIPRTPFFELTVCGMDLGKG